MLENTISYDYCDLRTEYSYVPWTRTKIQTHTHTHMRTTPKQLTNQRGMQNRMIPVSRPTLATSRMCVLILCYSVILVVEDVVVAELHRG